MKYLSIGFLFLTACATVSPAFMRDDKQVWEAQCDGIGRTIAVCHKMAAEKCEGKYTEMGGEGTSSAVPMGRTFAPIVKRSLLFTCNE